MAYDDEVYGGFDAEIGEEADAGGFVLLPEGTYPFTISRIEKQRFSGSDNMPACPLVVATLAVDGGEAGTAYVNHRLYMTKKQSWKVKQLFVGVGLVQADAERFVPPWDRAFGASGYVKLSQHEYNGRTYNDVDRILKPEDAQRLAAEQVAAPQAARGQNPPWGA